MFITERRTLGATKAFPRSERLSGDGKVAGDVVGETDRLNELCADSIEARRSLAPNGFVDTISVGHPVAVQLVFGNGGNSDVTDISHASESPSWNPINLRCCKSSNAESLDEFEAAILDEEIEGRGAGIKAILEELLDGEDRTLNDLANNS
ncbi:hypothetical protein LR48_Vigan01g104000 [Vigna angularis]|uniref:Uncharacterized protein n=1 Tax=Phaseolus angularis TaxID=3914 RepID=A0A0L9TLR7_PHAAN|nr:hypothetical protein LR48_Vigan01g104000 [Vigna angularis]